MAAKKVDVLEERLEGEMNQIKTTVEERMSSMEGQVADLHDMIKKMLEVHNQTAASIARSGEGKSTNSEIHREEEEVEIVEGERRRPHLEPIQREERGGWLFHCPKEERDSNFEIVNSHKEELTSVAPTRNRNSRRSDICSSRKGSVSIPPTNSLEAIPREDTCWNGRIQGFKLPMSGHRYRAPQQKVAPRKATAMISCSFPKKLKK
ncbi:hypothetical protein M5K25_003711 [Dendrobium thyrsiflorum]|uniref:Uncharacterized protein n=1 Tax=Dendrobium thyrsiflorum TaxID=117978 RepID=A0ABD0VS75_DENTH